MKTKILTLIMIIGIGFLNSCNNDDNDSLKEKTINGTWYLKNVGGGLASINVDYKRGDIKWIFNQTNNTLIVDNHTGNDNGFMLQSRAYTYNIEQKGETQIIFLDNGDYRMVVLSMENNLLISDGMADGFTAEFQR